MLAKAIAVFALIAAVNGGAVSYLAADPHIGAQAEHTVRGFGGLSSVSQYSKAVDSPFSSVRKTDTRVTNDAISAYAAPIAHGYAAPIAHGYAGAPLAAHGYAAPLAHGYAAPAAYAHHAAPLAAHGYAAPLAHGYAAPAGYAAPLAAHGYAAPLAHGYAAPAAYGAHHKVVGGPAIGVSYSAVSPAVATYNFNGLGVSYGY